MPFSHPEDTHLVRVSVTPEQRILSSGGKQQLVVSAFYSDGTRQDVTRHTQFLSSDDNSVPVDARGLISVPSDGKQRAASAAIMARYRGKIAIARISVPRPGPPPDGPSVEARNFIDRIVFANLRELGISQSEVCDDYTFIRRASIDIVGKHFTAGFTTASPGTRRSTSLSANCSRHAAATMKTERPTIFACSKTRQRHRLR